MAPGDGICHVVAMPYPGRGHVNPMMNLCKLLASRKDDILITIVITEEWLDLIGSQDKLPSIPNLRFATIPNVIPSERVRAADFPGFIEAVSTKLEAPFEQLLDRLEPPVSAIIADTNVSCAFVVGNRRSIPAATLWTMSVTVFSVFHHFDLLIQNKHHPLLDLSERGEERVDYIPGVSSMRLSDLPTIFSGDGQQVLKRVLELFSWVPKSQYLLFTSVYELEHQAFDVLKRKFSFPVYTLGPTIPYFNLEEESITESESEAYMKWLDCQPKASVLYVSLGSFLSVSKAEMDEIAAGLRSSGVRFLWVGREKASELQEACGDDGGLVVAWCDQLKVLSHSSVGGFWSHCGWNSTLEAVFAGVPMLTFPIFWDQVPNSKKIVEEWMIGWRVNRDATKDEIGGLVSRFMDGENNEVKEMRKRAKQLEEVCRGAIGKGGSTHTNLDAFLSNISHPQPPQPLPLQIVIDDVDEHE